MADARSISASFLAAAALLGSLAGCRESLGVPETNRVPIARARVVGADGVNVAFDYRGMPVEVTLDASGSRDPDGRITSYRWLSGDLQQGAPAAGSSGSAGGAVADDSDAGTDPSGVRWVPPGEPADWPPDVAQPVLRLAEGTYTFVLWVVDDQSTVSDPSRVTVTINPPLPPAVAACVDGALPGIDRACKACVCDVSDACRAAASQSVCGADCWGLLSCIGGQCPEYLPGGDTSCLVSNCAAFLPGATGAQAIGPCLTPVCRAACTR